MSEDFTLHLTLAIVMTLVALFAIGIAERRSFFTLPSPPEEKKITAGYLSTVTLSGFICFLFFTTLLVPYLTLVTLCPSSGTCHLTLSQKGWMTINGALVSTAVLIMLTYTHNVTLRQHIWGKFHWHHILFGIMSWLVSYPVMVAVGQWVATLLAFFTQIEPTEQLAVQELRSVRDHPLLIFAFVITVGIIVPIAEELLFRGMLQSTLKKFMSRYMAISVAAAIFALFHFSPEQGFSNIELLASLFTFALFLGYIYEREGSLWAPIALHATFNSISMLFILS
jgi:membrane protease YdiL (CAAX protease family)